LDQIPELVGREDLCEAHRLYANGEVDAAHKAFHLIQAVQVKRAATFPRRFKKR
jgi:hypothetical protein